MNYRGYVRQQGSQVASLQAWHQHLDLRATDRRLASAQCSCGMREL